MRCQDAREMMSGYLEHYLTDPEIELMLAHLEDCEECRLELEDLRSTMCVMHDLPRQGPVYDLWEEFAPKIPVVMSEVRLGTSDRLRLYFIRLFGSLSEGWSMFTTVVGLNTHKKVQRYLMGRPG